MSKDYCDLTILLDKSGSMEGVKSDTIGGINSFLDEQSKVSGECRVSLYQFDDEYETTYENALVSVVPRLNNDNYKTRGWTALLDAIGKTVNSIGHRLSKLHENDRPSKVILVIQSDGQENRSKEFTRIAIFDMIKHQQEKYNWNFVFLGANMDAIATASSYGISSKSSMTYAANSVGTSNLYKSLSDKLCCYRSAENTVCDSFQFDDNDRKMQEEELNKV